MHRMTLARVLVVVRDLRYRRIRPSMLELESRHEHAATPVCAECKCDRTLGRCERESGVVQDVMHVEQSAPGKAALLGSRGQRLATLCELFRANSQVVSSVWRCSCARSPSCECPKAAMSSFREESKCRSVKRPTASSRTLLKVGNSSGS